MPTLKLLGMLKKSADGKEVVALLLDPIQYS
jgi:hypothetical protein